MHNRRLLALIAVISVVVLGLTLVDLLREPTFPPIDELAIDLTERLLLVGAMVSVACQRRLAFQLRQNTRKQPLPSSSG